MEISEQSIKEILSQVGEINKDEIETLTGDSDLRTIGIDSLTSIELVVNLEEAFDISIGDDDLSVDNVATINAIIELIRCV